MMKRLDEMAVNLERGFILDYPGVRRGHAHVLATEDPGEEEGSEKRAAGKSLMFMWPDWFGPQTVH